MRLFKASQTQKSRPDVLPFVLHGVWQLAKLGKVRRVITVINDLAIVLTRVN